MDQGRGLSHAAVQIDGCKDGLHGIRQNGGALPAAAGFLAAAQLQIHTQSQLPCHLIQALLAHQCRADAGQIALRQIGVTGKQELRRHESQHGISQKLQPLVAVQSGSPVLVGVGAVVQRLLQQGRIPEGIVQFFLQFPHDITP